MLLRVQHAMPYDLAQPTDVVINTWYFLAPTGSPSVYSSISNALTAFYEAWKTYLSSEVAPNRELKFYDMGTPAPRYPIAEFSVPIAPGGTAGLPEECAICLSFQGAKVSGLPQRRRRGRVFLGPLGTGAAQFTSSRVRIATPCQSAINLGGQNLLAASKASTDWSWVVYSPTNASGGGTEESWAVPVANGWVDDTFDTIRSRGPRPSSRAVFA